MARYQHLARGVLGAALLLLVGGAAVVVHAYQLAAPAPGAVCPSASSGATAIPTPYVGIPPRNDCTPSFNEQDVRDFLAHTPNLGVSRSFAVFGQPEITSIQFVTIRNLARIYPVNVWVRPFPTALVVCYVVLRGRFLLAYGPATFPRTYVNTAFVLFDAHTGSLLTAGAYQQARRSAP